MRHSKQPILLLLTVIIFIAVFAFHRGGAVIQFQFDGDTLLVSGPNGFSFSAQLSDIESLTLETAFSPGSCVSGSSEGGYSAGTWENEALGRYQLCIRTKIKSCIVLKTADGEILAFNFESAGSTSELFRALSEYRENGGQTAASDT